MNIGLLSTFVYFNHEGLLNIMTNNKNDIDTQISQRLREINKRLKPLIEREEKARELFSKIPPAKLFVGVLGVNVKFDIFTIIDEFIAIRKISNPPGIIHICRASNLSKSNYLSVSRYSHLIKAEITLGCSSLNEDKMNYKSLLDCAWHFAVLLKLKGCDSIFCPFAASSSWDIISSISDNSVIFYELDTPSRQIITPSVIKNIKLEDLNWIKSNWFSAYELRDKNISNRFGLALKYMYIWNHTQDPRIAILNLWVGLEALFGVRSDRKVKEALAQRISDWVLSVSKDKVKHLYERRCDAVHGRQINEEDFIKYIKETEKLLRLSLLKCIEEKRRTIDDWK